MKILLANKALIIDLVRYLDKVKYRCFNKLKGLQTLQAFNGDGATTVKTRC